MKHSPAFSLMLTAVGGDLLPPEQTIRRAWPGKAGSLTLEITDTRTGELRAGTIDASGELTLLSPAGTDPKLPELAADSSAADAQLLVHRAGKRAVVRHPQKVTKHLKPSKVSQVATASEAVGRLAAASGFSVARVAATSTGRLDFSLLPGKSLFDWADQGQDAWIRFTEIWPEFLALGAQAYRSGQELPASSDGFSPAVHGSEREAQVLAQWKEQVDSFGAFVSLASGQLLLEYIDRLIADLASGTEDDYVLLHRDLHDKQLLWDGTLLALIDLDTAAYGEAALDLGNLLAHLELRAVQGIYSQGFSQTIGQRLESLASDSGISPQRLALYRQAARARIACVYSFRPSAHRWLGTWIDHTLNHL
ncbi:phosphotransferase [Rothia sp. SD9660Na]|uniref:phosphotransferase n=1 Tax=Rothia sp. SD9660Na TaxID=3047030 RepID=UPI0024B87B73|nr:phosphotransferase [Rothia sp. SD9660Na]WHS49752.1 phosphotransferase [Rothia sp. SD9660Na]